MSVIHTYTVVKIAIQSITTLYMAWLMLNRKITRPQKNKNSERCNRAGNPSTTRGTCSSSTPLAKNARIRARFSGLCRTGRVTLMYMYRRAHWCKDVARRAQVRLIDKLRNQSEFTQIAYLGGEKGGGLATEEGMRMGGTFRSTRSR